jgi:hypothetical protein
MADDNGKNRDLRAGQEHPRTLVFCAGALRVGDWIVACEIVKISVEGANVRATQVLEPVSLVTLSVDPCGDFECDVTWQDGETLGLTFREQGPRTQELYETLLQDPEGANGARDATRVQVLWSGQLRSKETSNDCRIVNVSLGGAKAHVSNPSDIISRCSTSPSPTRISKPSRSSTPSSPNAAAPSKPRPTSSKGAPTSTGGPKPTGRTDQPDLV